MAVNRGLVTLLSATRRDFQLLSRVHFKHEDRHRVRGGWHQVA
jgi:hypothetical protein